MFRPMLNALYRPSDLTREEVTIEARPNGPYVVTGTIELHDTNGNVLLTPGQDRALSLRCFYEKALLRRNPLKDRIPSRGTSGARLG
jgi:hypothetical protein